QHRLDRVRARLRPFAGRHDVLAKHDLDPLQRRRSLHEALVVLELVEANLRVLLVGMAFEAMLREKGKHGLLKRRPIARGPGRRRLATTARDEGQKHETVEYECGRSEHGSSPAGRGLQGGDTSGNDILRLSPECRN